MVWSESYISLEYLTAHAWVSASFSQKKRIFSICENENIDALGNSVDHIVICWLSITEIGLKPRHPVGVDCRNVM